jgi:hypothetical protein
MKNFKVFFLVSLFTALLTLGCQDDPNFTREPSASIMEKKPNEAFEPSGSYGNPGGTPVPYPEIIRQTFIPRDDIYGYKCTAWKITWPAYPIGYDANKIPTTFSLNGALNSFYYLNNVAPETTWNTLFSLFYENKIQGTINMPEELDYFENPPENYAYVILRLPSDEISVAELQHIVENSPSVFPHEWINAWENEIEELEYNEGDLVLFQAFDPDPLVGGGYGAIRIVSMNPRIIEVYKTSLQ